MMTKSTRDDVDRLFSHHEQQKTAIDRIQIDALDSSEGLNVSVREEVSL